VRRAPVVRAASGHAAAAPTRCTRDTGGPSQSVCRTLTLPQEDKQVLWSDLKGPEMF